MTLPRREPVGLLAGSGRFPVVFAAKARSLGIPVVCVGIRHEASPELADLADRFYWAGIARLGRMIRCFKREGVRRIVMAGKVHKARYLYAPWRTVNLLPDLRSAWFWLKRMVSYAHNRDDDLLLAVIDEFRKDGMDFDSALNICPELLAAPGVLTRRKPTRAEEADIAFGWQLAKEMGRLDVGQSVAVKERAVLAVEAIEGTDRAILRAGELCPAGGFVVVKVAKPQQDMRFDVPTIGPTTVENLHRAGGRVLAIEAGKTIILDQDQTVALADRFGLTIVAVNLPDLPR
ncbi:MAG: UDP-2,3-diacylglucosamine diphosphatase LpxI [Gemmatales bacterium]|nr:UDP-2,3-diacylglucosamine diphosphatase LpxI [Gemmatales bacterium]MDW8385951.1 UDP-2,3-diacylglucosamine diphosphatase LpxI [Gemmatales bacterium]